MAGLNVLFLVVLHWGIKGYLLATNISYLLSFAVSFILGKIWIALKSAELDKTLFKAMLAYSAPLALNTLAWHIVSSTDKIMIERMVDTNALGLYTLAAKIPALINVFIAVFQQSWGISSIKEYESTNDSGFYSNVFSVYYIGIYAICIILSAFMKPFMSVYVGAAFTESARYVPLLLVSSCFSALAVYYAGLYGALKKSTNIMVTVLISGIINVLLNYILIRSVGLLGAVIGTLVAYIVMFVIRAVDVNRIIKIQIDWFRFVFNSTIVMLQSIICTIDYHVLPLSFVAITIFVFVNQKDIRLIALKIYNSLHR
jgi:O-antigen/teichoic acid export membrane protein